MVPQSHLYILTFFGEVNILEHLIETYLLTVEKMVLFSSFLKSAHFPALSINYFCQTSHTIPVSAFLPNLMLFSLSKGFLFWGRFWRLCF